MDQAQTLAIKRVTTLMTPAEKSALKAKVRQSGLSVGAFIRRSIEAYDPKEAEALTQLAAFAAELTRSNHDTAAAIDRALASTEVTIAQLKHRPTA